MKGENADFFGAGGGGVVDSRARYFRMKRCTKMLERGKKDSVRYYGKIPDNDIMPVHLPDFIILC